MFPPVLERYRGKIRYEHVKTDTLDGFKRLLAYERRYNCKSNESVRVLVGSRCLLGMEQIRAALQSAIAESLAEMSPDPSPKGEERPSLPAAAAPFPEGRADHPTPSAAESESAAQAMDVSEPADEKFAALTLGVVIVAGLVDGVNPCAFVTLVFLMSVLANLKKPPREIFVIGSMFALSVFLTYLLLGFGVFRALKAFSVSSGVAAGLKYGVASLALFLAFFSFTDFLKCGRGEARAMALTVPLRFRRTINRLINTRMRRRHWVLWSLAIGFVVSLLESVCTGQLYLPTIMYVLRVGGENAVHAFLLLVLYNAMFVTPLILVFSAVCGGVSSGAVRDWFNKNLAMSKMLVCLLFLCLGLLLLFAS